MTDQTTPAAALTTPSIRDYCAQCRTKVMPARDGKCPYCAGSITVAPPKEAAVPAERAQEVARDRPLALSIVYVILTISVGFRALAVFISPLYLIGVVIGIVTIYLLSERNPKGIGLASFLSVAGFLASVLSIASAISSGATDPVSIVVELLLSVVGLSIVFLLHSQKVREEFPDY